MRQRSFEVLLWIVSRLVPEREREALVGDLVEEFGLRANASSVSAALKWCVQQVFASAPPLLLANLRRTAWPSTIGVAMLAYIAVGIVEFGVNWAMSLASGQGSEVYNPVGMLITFPMVVTIGYFAARLRPGAPVVLATLMLAAVTVMTLSANESVPVWYRIAYFIVGPAAVGMGSAARARRSPRESGDDSRRPAD
jgi:hypothetical protein